ncbi:MAG: ATP-binding protein [Acidimicrobiales bacterium]
MDKVANPFNPGAGYGPPLLVGREAQIEAMTIAVKRLSVGRFERSMILKGLRGVGKTVLLNEFGKIALSNGWVHAHLEATEDTRTPHSLAALVRRSLLELSFQERAKNRAQRALGVLRSFVKVHVPAGDGTLTIDFEPQPGKADSGDLDADLSGVFSELGEVAKAAGTGVLFTIDEMQYLTQADLSALIVGLHRVSQLGLPFLVAGAGLPSLPGLASEARSYAERLFAYVDIGALSHEDALRALVDPVVEQGASWSTAAVELVVLKTEGYPYFLQEFGKQAWNVASGTEIGLEDVEQAMVLAVDDLDHGFFRARIDRTTDAERDYLRAMAKIGEVGPYQSGEIARVLDRTTQQSGPVRDSLIKRGLCFAPRHGALAFTVPMFASFINRTL